MLHHAGRIVRTPLVLATLALAAWYVSPGLLPGSSAAFAQNTNATIRGLVIDPAGALIPNAQVVIVNQETGVTVFNGKSDSAGTFVAPQVIPGMYRITVNATGLKQAVIDNLAATVAQVASVNVHMEIGAASDTVTVESKGVELDRSTSDISTLISPSDVQNLPLSGRATENLLAFIPGVVHGGAGDHSFHVSALDQWQPHFEHGSSVERCVDHRRVHGNAGDAAISGRHRLLPRHHDQRSRRLWPHVRRGRHRQHQVRHQYLSRRNLFPGAERSVQRQLRTLIS